MSKEMSKGRVGHTQGVTATIANREINTTLLLLLLSLWKSVQYYCGNTNTVLAKRGRNGADPAPQHSIPRRQGMSSALVKHRWHSFSTPSPGLIKQNCKETRNVGQPKSTFSKMPASSENIQAECTTPVTFREQMVSSQV